MKIVLGLLFLTSALFLGCQTASAPTKAAAVARINIGSEPQSLDPRKARDIDDLTISRMLFEGLTRIDITEKPQLALARDCHISEDRRLYTFFLRDAKWSNGERVTAEDFVYAWKKVLHPAFISSNAFQLYVIKNAKLAKEGKISPDEVGIRALDPYTISIELEQPTPYFLELLSCPIFFPVNHQVDQKVPHWSEQAAAFVGNGPFLLTSWKHHDVIEVEKNPNYWDAKEVLLPKIEMVMVKEEAEFNMFEKGELHWAGSPLTTLSIDALPHLKKEGHLKTKPFLGTYFIRINTEKAPFNHRSMRKAFAYALDRQALIDHVLQGGQDPATGLVPTAMGLQKKPYFRDGGRQQARDLFEQELSLLQQTREQLPRLTLTYMSTNRNHVLAQAIQQQWYEAFGILVELEGVEKKVLFDRISKENYQMIFSSWIADFNDPINFLEIFKFKTASTNNTHWENPRYTELLTASGQLKDPERRMDLLRKCEKLLIEEMPIIPIYHCSMLYISKEKLKDVVLSPLGSLDFKWARLEEGDAR